MRRTTGFWMILATVLFSLGAAMSANAFPGQTTRVSVNTGGVPANAAAANGVLSADGRFVVFQSSATNLAGVSVQQIYRHDRTTGATVLVSVTKTGGAGAVPSRDPSISADGRYVAFGSFASDLADGDTNGFVSDVFVRDMQTAMTKLVSASSGGAVGNAGSLLNGLPGARQISDDGRYVAFTSLATNLTDANTSGVAQVYVKDMSAGALVRASVTNGAGVAGDLSSVNPSISGNGRFVAFSSASTNFSTDSTSGSRQQVFIRDLVAGATTLESPGTAALTRNAYSPALSFDGGYLAYVAEAPLDPLDLDNGVPDVYLSDRVAGTTVLVSRSFNGVGGDSLSPSISGDGRWVAFNSADEIMVGGDTNLKVPDIFLYDRDSHAVTIVSRNDAGDQATTQSFGASLSFDGHVVLFSSAAPNLVTLPSSTGNQLYVRNLVSNQAPVVTAGGDETVNEGDWLKRTGSFSDADVSTSWTGTADFGAGPFPILLDPVKRQWAFSHEPLVVGNYVVTISVTDNDGATGTATFRHTVRNVAPSVDLGAEAFLYFDATLHRLAIVRDPGTQWPVPQPTETYSATVDYGDGEDPAALEMIGSDGNLFWLDHVYANAGTYVVTVTATDSNGGVGSGTLTVHVFKYAFAWLDPVGEVFVVGRNLPVKFDLRGPNGAFVLDRSVVVDVVDANGAVVAGPYVLGDQPSRSVTWNGDSYHVNVDTKDLAPGMYWLRVRFSSPTLTGELTLGTTGTTGSTTTTKSRGLR